jgi:hypothetical protein
MSTGERTRDVVYIKFGKDGCGSTIKVNEQTFDDCRVTSYCFQYGTEHVVNREGTTEGFRYTGRDEMRVEFLTRLGTAVVLSGDFEVVGD